MDQDNGKLIAIDYDETYSVDSVLWDHFINLALLRGHRVICVSCRRDTLENRNEMKVPVPLYLTDLSAKRWFMEQRGIFVDIWIDDRPEYVVHGV